MRKYKVTYKDGFNHRWDHQDIMADRFEIHGDGVLVFIKHMGCDKLAAFGTGEWFRVELMEA